MSQFQERKDEDIIYSELLELTNYQPDIYTQIEKYVQFLQESHSRGLHELKNIIFKTLLQILLPYLKKVGMQFYCFDPLVDKSAPEKRRPLSSDNPTLPEYLVDVIGILWELILKYDKDRGVYFTHYIQLQFNWRYKKLSRTRLRKKKYIARPEDDYKLVSYEELTDESSDYSYGSAKIGDMTYDDNFNEITFEWALNEPQEFVDDDSLFEALSSFTPKQLEVLTMELKGYYQEQIAAELKKQGVQITQQAVSERLLGLRKKIEKIQNKRGVLHESRKQGNYTA